MPEGDAVFLTAHRLHTALAGREVTRFELRVPTLALADLRGRTIVEVRPRAKHILMRFDDHQTLHSHLRMDGSWRVGPAAQSPRGGPSHAIRALVGTADKLAVGLRVHDLAIVATQDEAHLVGHLGPDLLDPACDVAEAVTRLTAAADLPLGIALLDQRLVGGLGTIWRSELLWLHRLSPFDPVSAAPDLEALIRDGTMLLRGSVDRQLQPRPPDPFRAHEGQLEVYGRYQRPCRRCGTLIERGYLGPDASTERIVYFCPACQPHRHAPQSALQ